jgi:hypothetical protein
MEWSNPISRYRPFKVYIIFTSVGFFYEKNTVDFCLLLFLKEHVVTLVSFDQTNRTVGEWKMRAKLLLEDFMEKYRNQSRIFRNRSVLGT